MANKICKKYDLRNLVIPDEYKCKDISDLVKEKGINVGYFLLKMLIYEKV